MDRFDIGIPYQNMVSVTKKTYWYASLLSTLQGSCSSVLCRGCVLGTFSTLKSGMSPIILTVGANVPTHLRFMNGNITEVTAEKLQMWVKCPHIFQWYGSSVPISPKPWQNTALFCNDLMMLIFMGARWIPLLLLHGNLFAWMQNAHLFDSLKKFWLVLPYFFTSRLASSVVDRGPLSLSRSLLRGRWTQVKPSVLCMCVLHQDNSSRQSHSLKRSLKGHGKVIKFHSHAGLNMIDDDILFTVKRQWWDHRGSWAYQAGSHMTHWQASLLFLTCLTSNNM